MGRLSLDRQAFTLFEIIIVLIIISVILALVFPNFTTPTEQARASVAWNNLLAIYSAQQNYNNNNGGYCFIGTTPTACGSISDINTALSLNIQDDGTYLYTCNNTTTCNNSALPATTPCCTATRLNGPASFSMAVTLNAPVQTNQNNPNLNPACNPATSNWCP